MDTVWIAVQLLIGYNLVFPGLLFLSSCFKKKRIRQASKKKELDYAIIVTAYEQTQMLPFVVESLLSMNYKLFHIYIVADKCEIEGLNFIDQRVSILRPDSVLANNVKSHFYAIERFVRTHDVLTIIDSDNTVDPEYLSELNLFFNQGFRAVQGIRKAKGVKTQISQLDAARDHFYHYYDGELLFKLGSSCTLSGSGMAFEIGLYKNCWHKLSISGAGFDKVLQWQIVKAGLRIAYAPDAIVYDEKTSYANQLITQRSRWINSWFKYFKYGYKLILAGINRRNINQLLFGLVLVRPPIFILILLSILCLVINFLIDPILSIIWIAGLLAFVMSFLLSLNKQKSSPEMYLALLSIPRFVYYQLVSLYYSRVANKRSISTRHITPESATKF